MRIIFFVFLVSIASCSSYKSKVIETQGDSSLEDWITRSEDVWEFKGRVYARAEQSGEVDSRISALKRMATVEAKTKLTTIIQSKVTSMVIFAQESTAMNGDVSRSLSSVSSSVVSSGLRVEKTFWIKKLVPIGKDQSELRIHAHALVSIEKLKLRKMIKKYADSNKKISAAFMKAIDKKMENLIDE